MRSCDDIDEQALSYAEIKALCAGDPRIREKMDLDVQVAKLKVLRGDFQNQKYRLEDKLLKTFPEEIQKQKTRIAALQQDSQIAAAHPQDKENFCGMTIKGMVYDDKKAAGERLLLARQEMPNADMMLLGTYRGFELNIRFDSFKNEHQAVLRAELSYPVSLGDDARGNITRLDNAIDNFTDRIADAENALQNLEQQKQAAEVEVAKPFAQEEELAEKSARLAELNALLNIDRDRSSSQDTPEESEETETPATRPSVLAALGEKTNQPEPVKPFRSYYDKDGDAEENCSFPDFSLCGVSSSDGKVAANPVQLCSCSADALHLRLRHLHCLPSDLEPVLYPAGGRVHLLHPLFRCNCHHRGYRAFQ